MMKRLIGELQHEFLSVLNTICSSVIANKQFITSTPLKGGAQSKVVWTYNIMVKALVKGSTNWTEKEILHFCSKSCSESYGTSFINTTQFEKIYKKVCVWNGTVPACPSLQNHLFTTAVTSQTSTLSPNRNASVQSPNFEAQKTEYHVLSAVVPSLIIIIIMGIIIIIIMGTIIRRQRNSQDH
ncbi:hypothetical protein QTP86_031349 [Hemibagrus guttatus]|nr:hypothetical protein QTP86_031349 [Hemibagrus guttatus]